MKAVEFHPEAEAEFIAAAEYYEARAKNLGLDFISAVERAYTRLIEFPDSGHPFGGRLRRAFVPGFPYASSTAAPSSDSSSSLWPTSIDALATGEREARWGAA